MPDVGIVHLVRHQTDMLAGTMRDCIFLGKRPAIKVGGMALHNGVTLFRFAQPHPSKMISITGFLAIRKSFARCFIVLPVITQIC